VKSRDQRAAMARETLAIVDAGHYATSDGRRVDIGAAARECIVGTRLWQPDELAALRARIAARPRPERGATTFTTADEGTLAAARRLCADGSAQVGVLNFASARNPGGGFLGGSQAQEESLARSSALYASQTAEVAAPFYAHHRAEKSVLYTDRVIVSPACPVFRDDEGRLLDSPYNPTFFTCAAPNAGALSDHRDAEGLASLPGIFARRAAHLLAAAVETGCDVLVLGAWGCGVFRNDPVLVAGIFRALLVEDGEFAGRFAHVSFAVLDNTPARACLRAFEDAFAGAAPSTREQSP
jgi:uncharacterized protein (TIGR02452 family)